LPRFLSRFPEVSQEHGPLQALRRLDGITNDVAVGDEDVLCAIEIEVDEAGSEAGIIETDACYSSAATGEDELVLRELPGPPGITTDIPI